MYRENYEEKIQIEYISFEDAIKLVGADLTNVPASERSKLILKVTETSWYTVIPPSKSDAEYVLKYGGKSADMPFFPVQNRIALMVGENEATSATLPLKITDDPLGGISYVAAHKTLPIRGGKCDVWLRTVEYRLQTTNHIS